MSSFSHAVDANPQYVSEPDPQVARRLPLTLHTSERQDSYSMYTGCIVVREGRVLGNTPRCPRDPAQIQFKGLHHETQF